MRKGPGSYVELGDILGHPQEPDLRWGRLVGIRKDGCPPIEEYIIRLFKSTDEKYPTGEHKTTSHLFLCAWEGDL